jgi:hypothetical protein
VWNFGRALTGLLPQPLAGVWNYAEPSPGCFHKPLAGVWIIVQSPHRVASTIPSPGIVDWV